MRKRLKRYPLKNRLSARFASSALQVFALQVLSGVFFYTISIYVSKADFGAINWMNSVGIFTAALTGMGLEQVVVRRIAASRRSDWSAGAFMMHNLLGLFVGSAVLVILKELLYHDTVYRWLPWFFAAQAMLALGTPLKQLLNAREKFTPYGVIALISNLAKIAAIIGLVHTGGLTVRVVAAVMIAGALFEWVCLLVYLWAKGMLNLRFKVKAYFMLIKEAIPQYISVIFDMSLSRMDWIMLGLLGTAGALADYSFAYRAFEMGRLPVSVIAPLILPRFARMMAGSQKPGKLQQDQIGSFNRTEATLAAAIVLILNILWTPLVGWITGGKYGPSNATLFLLLSLCLPMLFYINLLWSVSFAARRYRQVSAITMSCAVVNIILNLILIPFFAGIGSAVAFLITCILQSVLYHRIVSKQLFNIAWWPPFLLVACSLVIYIGVKQLHIHYVLQLAIGVPVFIGMAAVFNCLRVHHIRQTKQLLS